MPKSPKLSFREETPDARDWSDSEFLSRVAWSRSVPRAIVAAAADGDLHRVVEHHCGLLQHAASVFEKAARRGRSIPMATWSRDSLQRSTACQPLLAMVEDVAHVFDRTDRNGQTERLVEQINAGLTDWLAEHKTLGPAETFCLIELVGSGIALLDEQVLSAAWCRALRSAMLVTWDLEAGQPAASGAEQPESADEKLLWEGELRWRIGLMFADVKGARQVRRAGVQELQRQLLEYTDTDGTPFAPLVPRLPLWLAVFVRSLEWGDRYEQSLWNAEASDRFRALTALSATLLGTNGRLSLSPQPAIELMRHAAAYAGFDSTEPPRALVKRVRQLVDGRSTAKKVKADQRPTIQSDWARLAGLRSTWSADADAAVIAHHAPTPLLQLRCRGETVVEGDWGLQLRISGKRLTLTPDWTCVCWHSDRDVDYAELQLVVDSETQIGRQVLLWRKRRMLLLADVVATRANAAIQYTMRLPLREAIEVRHEADTREAALVSPQNHVRVLPLSLPDDIIQGTSGTLTEFERQLEYDLSGRGGLYAPLVLYWDDQERKAAADWNRLTITESRRILDPSDADAFRLRIGRRQWLFYRRLNGSTQLQTVLGHHTGHETVIGAFPRTGDVQPDLLVEA